MPKDCLALYSLLSSSQNPYAVAMFYINLALHIVADFSLITKRRHGQT